MESLAASHCWAIQSAPRKVGSSALAWRTGNADASVTCCTSVDLPTWRGVAYALASDAITSGLGYAIWYTVLPALKATSAATVQLSVPVIAALGGIVFLNEALTLRFVLASAAVLGGIALVILAAPSRRD